MQCLKIRKRASETYAQYIGRKLNQAKKDGVKLAVLPSKYTTEYDVYVDSVDGFSLLLILDSRNQCVELFNKHNINVPGYNHKL